MLLYSSISNKSSSSCGETIDRRFIATELYSQPRAQRMEAAARKRRVFQARFKMLFAFIWGVLIWQTAEMEWWSDCSKIHQLKHFQPLSPKPGLKCAFISSHFLGVLTEERRLTSIVSELQLLQLEDIGWDKNWLQGKLVILNCRGISFWAKCILVGTRTIWRWLLGTD